jgi:spermidine synthase
MSRGGGRERREAGPQIAVSDERGVRYLHFGTVWVQGAMRLRRPWDIELDYLRHMMAWQLFVEPRGEILQIGLGAASLAKYAWKRLPQARVVVVEVEPAVVAVARQQFGLPPEDDRLELVIDDGARYVAHPRNRGRFPVIQVDAYDAAANGPVLGGEAFYAACRRALAEPGVLVVTLFGLHSSLDAHLADLDAVFEGRVKLLPPVEAGNVIALAFAGPRRVLPWRELYERATAIEESQPLRATGWVNALRDENPDGAEGLHA